MTFCFQITDKGIDHLAKNCKKLQKLDLQGWIVSILIIFIEYLFFYILFKIHSFIHSLEL